MTWISVIEPGGGTPLYQLKITLKWSKPPIWRRVVVRRDMELERLHNVIQVVMGWTDSHLHQFITGSGTPSCVRYILPDPEGEGFGESDLDENDYAVGDIAPAAKAKFIYEYDFGDGWQHEVVVEKILPPDPSFKHPVCLGGEKACPPEDCGGIPGYYRLLEILSDRKHPEYREMKEWAGDDVDPEDFSLEAVNKVLKKIKT